MSPISRGFVPPKMERLSELPRSPAMSLLYYGGSGVGKTFFCGTAGDRSIYLDCGVGPLETMQSLVFKEKVGTNPIIIKLREQFGDNRLPKAEAFETLWRLYDWILDNRLDDIDTICTDNALALRTWARNAGMKWNQANNKSQTWSEMQVSKNPVLAPKIQDFGREMNMIAWLFETYTGLFKDAGKNFIVTAHVRETWVKGENIGDPKKLIAIRPGFTGETFPDDVPALFDEVWYAVRAGGGDKATYRMKPYGDEIEFGKTSHGAGTLRNQEDNPNFLSILERIRKNAPQPKLVLRR